MMAEADADQPKTRLQHRLKGSQEDEEEEEIQQRHSTTNAIINS